VRIARQRLLYLFHGTEMLFAMGRRPDITEDELARAASHYLSLKGGFIEKIKAMPPAILSSQSPPDIFGEEVDEAIETHEIILGNTAREKQATRRALLRQRIEVFLLRAGYADDESYECDPQDFGLDDDRIVEAVNREAQRALQEQLKNASHYQQIQQLPRAKAGLRFSENIEQFIVWREKARPRRLVKSGRASLTKQTLAQMQTTYRLFSSIMKDPVLTTVDRKMVQDFREALELLPSSHGKTNGKVSARPARTYLQELERKKRLNSNRSRTRQSSGIFPH
jgi:hypothetical protein